MADQTTGGDGSVKWSIDADQVNPADVRSDHTPGPGGRGHQHQHGKTDEGTIDDWMTISLKVPAEVGSVDAYLAAIKEGDANAFWGVKRDRNGDRRIYLNLRIEGNNNDQVRVSWGSSAFVFRP
jgi:hypothetical protein